MSDSKDACSHLWIPFSSHIRCFCFIKIQGFLFAQRVIVFAPAFCTFEFVFILHVGLILMRILSIYPRSLSLVLKWICVKQKKNVWIKNLQSEREREIESERESGCDTRCWQIIARSRTTCVSSLSLRIMLTTFYFASFNPYIHHPERGYIEMSLS